MKLLLHICCGPCSIYPIRILRQEDIGVSGFFYQSNIHPYTECLKRLDTLRDYARQLELPLIVDQAYDLEGFLRNIAYRESERCRICYYQRLSRTAMIARHGKFDGFSTTLLYSKFQKHELIRSVGEAIGREMGVPFHYRDFRAGWKEGVTQSKKMGMYRQQYCGCIYSEKERYMGRAKSGETAPPVDPTPDQTLHTSAKADTRPGRPRADGPNGKK